jgi:molybdopterin-guanine dinucleotide biosynthesis protein A
MGRSEAKEVPPVGGYVLAGGRSSRMGRDKALLPLAGKTLVEHAVTKLQRLCAKVSVLSGNPELAAYAPLVPDNFGGSGPLGGIEAALLDSEFAWNLILPVDMPFLPTKLLDDWIYSALQEPIRDVRISMLSVDGQAYPTLLLIHRDVIPYLRADLEVGRYKVLVSLESAAQAIAAERRVEPERVFWRAQYDDPISPKWRNADKAWKKGTRGCLDWFANLNTPKEFAEAEKHSDALDA